MGILIALLLGLFANAPAMAQSADDPAATVRAFYATDGKGAQRFYSKRLKALFVRDERKAKAEGMGNLDFDFKTNGQDTEDGWEKTLRFELISKQGERAQVKAGFRNFSPQNLRYELVRENGRWLIDDARALGKKPWRLSKILAQ